MKRRILAFILTVSMIFGLMVPVFATPSIPVPDDQFDKSATYVSDSTLSPTTTNTFVDGAMYWGEGNIGVNEWVANYKVQAISGDTEGSEYLSFCSYSGSHELGGDGNEIFEYVDKTDVRFAGEEEYKKQQIINAFDYIVAEWGNLDTWLAFAGGQPWGEEYAGQFYNEEWQVPTKYIAQIVNWKILGDGLVVENIKAIGPNGYNTDIFAFINDCVDAAYAAGTSDNYVNQGCITDIVFLADENYNHASPNLLCQPQIVPLVGDPGGLRTFIQLNKCIVDFGTPGEGFVFDVFAKDGPYEEEDILATLTTNEDGEATFMWEEGLAEGAYILRERKADGYIQAPDYDFTVDAEGKASIDPNSGGAAAEIINYPEPKFGQITISKCGGGELGPKYSSVTATNDGKNPNVIQNFNGHFTYAVLNRNDLIEGVTLDMVVGQKFNIVGTAFVKLVNGQIEININNFGTGAYGAAASSTVPTKATHTGLKGHPSPAAIACPDSDIIYLYIHCDPIAFGTPGTSPSGKDYSSLNGKEFWFKVTSEDDSYSESKKVIAGGDSVTWGDLINDLVPGWYFIEEVDADGYVPVYYDEAKNLLGIGKIKVYVDAEVNLFIEVENEPEGDLRTFIQINKFINDFGTFGEGFVFDVFAKDGPYEEEDILATLTTDENGEATYLWEEGLAEDTYILRERKADGYVQAPDYEFTVDAEGKSSLDPSNGGAAAEIVNYPELGSLTFEKRVDGKNIVEWLDENGYANRIDDILAGLEFYLDGPNGNYGPETPDENGLVSFADIVAGTYILSEEILDQAMPPFKTPMSDIEVIIASGENNVIAIGGSVISTFEESITEGDKFTIVNGYGSGYTLGYKGLNNSGDIFPIAVRNSLSGKVYPSFCAHGGSRAFAGESGLGCTGYVVAAPDLMEIIEEGKAAPIADFVKAYNYIESNYGNLNDFRPVTQIVTWILLGQIDIDSQAFENINWTQVENGYKEIKAVPGAKGIIEDVIANYESYNGGGNIASVVYMVCESHAGDGNPHSAGDCQPQLVPIYGTFYVENEPDGGLKTFIQINKFINDFGTFGEGFVFDVFAKDGPYEEEDIFATLTTNEDGEATYLWEEGLAEGTYILRERKADGYVQAPDYEFTVDAEGKSSLDPNNGGAAAEIINYPELGALEVTIDPTETYTENIYRPLWQKTLQPVYQKTLQPVYQKTLQPVYQKTLQPVYQKTLQPVYQKTLQPVYQKTYQPVYQKTYQPIWQKTFQPVYQMTFQPIWQRTYQPEWQKTYQPVWQKTYQPEWQKTYQPIWQKTYQPEWQKTYQPIWQKTYQPVWQKTYQDVYTPEFVKKTSYVGDTLVTYAGKPDKNGYVNNNGYMDYIDNSAGGFTAVAIPTNGDERTFVISKSGHGNPKFQEEKDKIGVTSVTPDGLIYTAKVVGDNVVITFENRLVSGSIAFGLYTNVGDINWAPGQYNFSKGHMQVPASGIVVIPLSTASAPKASTPKITTSMSGTTVTLLADGKAIGTVTYVKNGKATLNKDGWIIDVEFNGSGVKSTTLKAYPAPQQSVPEIVYLAVHCGGIEWYTTGKYEFVKWNFGGTNLVSDKFVRNDLVSDEFLNNKLVKDVFVRNRLVKDVFVENELKKDVFVRNRLVSDVFVENELVKDVPVRNRLVKDVLVENELVKDVLVRNRLVSDVEIRKDFVSDDFLRNDLVSDLLIRTDEISDLLVRTDEISDLLVRTDEISDLLIRTDEISDLLIRTDEISDLLIRTDEISDLYVGDELVSSTSGQRDFTGELDISVTGPEGYTYIGKISADDDWSWADEDLVPGEYTITISLEGVYTETKTETVVASELTRVEFDPIVRDLGDIRGEDMELRYLDDVYLDAEYEDDAYLDAEYEDDAYLDAIYLDDAYEDATYLDDVYLDATYLDDVYLDAEYEDDAYLDAEYEDDAYLDAIYLDDVYLEKTYIRPIYLRKTYTDPIYLEKIYIRPIYLRKTYKNPIFLDKIYLRDIYLRKVYLNAIFLDKVYLRDIYLRKIYARPVYLKKTYMESAYLPDLNLGSEDPEDPDSIANGKYTPAR